MNLIDSTYFTGSIALPGLQRGENVTGTAKILQTVGEKDLNGYIKKYQRKYLDVMTGKSLSAALFNGLELPDDNPEKGIWLSLKNRLANEEEKTSPIANCVYYEVMRYGRTQTAPTGEKKARSGSAGNVSGSDKMCLAWNEMVKMNVEFLEWLEGNFDTCKAYWGSHEIDMEDDLFIPINKFNIE
jgi:hypothetical protein